jgi:hypothetical protein
MFLLPPAELAEVPMVGCWMSTKESGKQKSKINWE